MKGWINKLYMRRNNKYKTLIIEFSKLNNE